MIPRKPDFPIARGVSPPPRPFRRQGPPRRPDTVIEGELVVPPNRRHMTRGSGLMIALQAVAVLGLAATSTAIGWWAFHGRVDQPAPPKPIELARVEPAKPTKPPAVAPIKPAEAPAAAPAAPPKKRLVDSPQTPASVVEKPVEKPLPAPPPPEKPAAKTTTSLTFAKDIQPILRAKCVNCHGDRNKFKGGLDARTLRSLEKGGETGGAINRSEPELSLFWDVIANGTMPPGKSNKLTDSEKKRIHDWLVGGGK